MKTSLQHGALTLARQYVEIDTLRLKRCYTAFLNHSYRSARNSRFGRRPALRGTRMRAPWNSNAAARTRLSRSEGATAGR